MASESKIRLVADKWVGSGLHVELAPLTKKCASGKYLEVELRPWAYLYNLVAHVRKRLDNLDITRQLLYQKFTNSNIHIKIGGDHGGGSFKMSYQICNVARPNRKENSVIFSLFEAKDSRSNLRICLERFKRQVQMLQAVKWNDKQIKVFLFGDYEFLCAMYGLTGANGT